jgi:hypothetical protein
MSDRRTPVSAPPSTVPIQVPSLAEVHDDPTVLSRLPVSVIVCLRRQVSHLAADIDTALFTAMGQTRQRDEPPYPDRLLTPEAAAERFGVTKRWLLDHTDQIPGVKRLSRKIVRFSERSLARFFDKSAV